MPEAFQPEPEPWPWYLAAFVGPLMPATTARRTDRLAFSRVLLVHLVGWVAAAGAGELLHMLANPSDPLGLMGHIVGELTVREPAARLAGFAALGGLLLMLEACVLVPGTLLSPWGARRESWPATLRRGLRRTLLMSLLWPIGLLLVGLPSVMVARAAVDWFSQSTPPLPAPTTSPAEQASSEYQMAILRHREAGEALWSSRPWYFRYSDELFFGLVALVLAWALWSLLRAIGAGDPAGDAALTPRCAACGYDLSASPGDGLCPECGEPVAASLSPAGRPGTSWERRGQVHAWRAFVVTSWTALSRPTSLGRQMRLTTPDRHHRWFLLAHLMVVGLLVTISIPLAGLGVGSDEPLSMPLWAAPWLVWTVIQGLALSTCAAGLLGGFESWRHDTGLVHVAMRSAAYAAPVILIWGCIWAAGARPLGHLVRWAMQTPSGLRWDYVAAATWGPPAVLLIIYVLVMTRIFRAARYAVR